MLSIYGQPQRLCDGLSRRELLTIGALGIGGLALPDLLRAESQQGIGNSRKAVIMIYLCGAPPHQDMFDLKMDAPAKSGERFSRSRRMSREFKSASICRGWRELWTNWCRFGQFTALQTGTTTHSSATRGGPPCNSPRAAGHRLAPPSPSCWGQRTKRFRPSSGSRHARGTRLMDRRDILAF